MARYNETEAISSNPQDVQIAGVFFASLPNGVLDRLIGKVAMSFQEYQ
jgi:hypothetical protein